MSRPDRGHPAERVPSGEQFVGDTGQRIDVVARIGILAEQHLRARVRRRQRAERARIELRAFVRSVAGRHERARDAEIQHLHLPALRAVGDEHVAGLEVRMHDALLVGVHQRPARPLDDRPGVFEPDSLRVALDEAIERLAAEKLHRHEDQRAVAVEVVDRDDVWMRKRLRPARFPLQRLERFRMLAELGTQELDRDRGIAVLRLLLAQVLRLEDHAHAAFADSLLQHEAALDDRAGLQRLLDTRCPAVDVVPSGAGGRAPRRETARPTRGRAGRRGRCGGPENRALRGRTRIGRVPQHRCALGCRRCGLKQAVLQVQVEVVADFVASVRGLELLEKHGGVRVLAAEGPLDLGDQFIHLCLAAQHGAKEFDQLLRVHRGHREPAFFQAVLGWASTTTTVMLSAASPRSACSISVSAVVAASPCCSNSPILAGWMSL